MLKIRTLFLSWDIEKSSLIALRCAAMHKATASRATVPIPWYCVIRTVFWFYAYSTVGCRRTGGRRSQPGSFLFFTTSANLVLILQSVFESRRLACSAQTVCDDACWAWNAAETFQTVEVEAFEVRAVLPKKSSSQQTLFACGEPFLAHFSSLGRSYF